MPVIGFLNPTSPNIYANRLRGFHRGLKEAGYVEGENVTIEYRWGENQNDRMATMAADLVRRRVAVIVTSTSPDAASTAKAATKNGILFQPSSWSAATRSASAWWRAWLGPKAT